MSLYFILLGLSFTIPLIFSFDKKLQFYRMWKTLVPSIFASGILFVVWDIAFTRNGVWGFNPVYIAGIYIIGLPIEEWLFFMIIPYCSIFIHTVIFYYHPELILPDKFVRLFAVFLMSIFFIITLIYYEKLYTFINSITGIIILFAALLSKNRILNRFLISFPVILIPFFVVNGILTGTFIQNEVVWYNQADILNIRILSIPVEDIFFAFNLILLVMVIWDKILKNNMAHPVEI